MKIIRMSLLGAALLGLTALTAHADHKMIQGRTGLPTVRDGGGNVWIERGVVTLNVSGDHVVTTQDYHLHYPGPPLETGPQTIQVAVREDCYHSRDNNVPEMTMDNARGFTAFSVYVDDRPISAMTEPWKVNDEKDTATR